MIIEDDKDIESLKEIGGICRDILRTLGSRVEPGITPLDLDLMAGKLLDEYEARSAPMLVYDFPGFTCISAEDAVAHGIPSDQPLREGTLVNIDVSAEKNGYFGDCGASFAVGNIAPDLKRLLKATEKAQRRAMMAARHGVPINTVGELVEQTAKEFGLKVVSGLNGHGVGRWIHEEPTVPNVRDRRNRECFEAGMVVTIEPFLATKSRDYVEDMDGWTLRLDKGGHGAQFEHSFVVTHDEPIILTA